MLLSIGDQVRPGSYRLHSVFKRAINYERRDRLVSVVDETIGPGPLNIVLRDSGRASVPASPDFSGGRANQGSRGRSPSRMAGSAKRPPPLRVTARAVWFEGCRYPFASRHRYDSTIKLRIRDTDRFQHNVSVLGEALKQDAPPKSLAFLLDRKRRKHFRSGFERAYARQIERGVRQVFLGHLIEGIRRLKGCGFGLTPGGDDFIAGLLIGLHLLQELRGQDLRSTRDKVFRATRGNNIFSNSFLNLAHRGLLFGRMKDLLRALPAGTEASVHWAATRLFAVGETSGADLATGFYLTLSDPDRTSRLTRVARASRADVKER
jgi:hypothetical protein